MTPPKQQAEQGTEDVQNDQTRAHLPRDPIGRVGDVVVSTDVQELLGIVGDDAVDLGPDAPSHHVDVVDRPDEDGPVGDLGVVEESPSGGTQ